MAEIVFKYSAMDAQGKEQKGEIVASNETEVNTKLKQQGLFPTSINKVGKTKAKSNNSYTLEEKLQKIEKTNEEIKAPRIIFSIQFFGFRFTIEKL